MQRVGAAVRVHRRTHVTIATVAAAVLLTAIGASDAFAQFRCRAGKEKCVACYLCAAACPSDCIYIEAETDPRPYEQRVGRDERYAKVYNIDYGRCIFCGFCVEACPKDAITHGYNFEISVYNRADLLKKKDDLLITKQKQSKNYRVALSSEDVDSEYKEV